MFRRSTSIDAEAAVDGLTSSLRGVEVPGRYPGSRADAEEGKMQVGPDSGSVVRHGVHEAWHVRGPRENCGNQELASTKDNARCEEFSSNMSVQLGVHDSGGTWGDELLRADSTPQRSY